MNKPTYRKTYPASNLEIQRGSGVRKLYTDTHCNTDGYPGSFKPIVIPEDKPNRGQAIIATLTASVLLLVIAAFYIAGTIS